LKVASNGEYAFYDGDLVSNLRPEPTPVRNYRHRVIERVVDADSVFEIKRLFAGELITALARIEGRPVGILANQPKVKGVEELPAYTAYFFTEEFPFDAKVREFNPRYAEGGYSH